MNGAPTSGDILGQTFSTYFANFGTFSAMCAVVLSPLILLNLYSAVYLPDAAAMAAGEAPLDFSSGPFMRLFILSTILNLILPYVATGAMVFGVFQHVRGRRAGVGECLSVGLRRFFPVLVVSLIVGIFTFIGAMLCLVPGILVYVFLAMAVPALVLERRGIGAALQRSIDLGDGSRWTVFGVLFALIVMMVVVSFIGGGIGGLFMSPLLQAVVTSVILVLWTGIQATGVTLLYYNLRRQKESVDADQIAEVFA